MNDILDIFYNRVIPGAISGEVDCELLIHIIFSVYYEEDNKRIIATDRFKNVIIPTLVINNKSEFDTALTSYIQKALLFYSDKKQNYLSHSDYTAYLMCLAIVNMSQNDYLNPVDYFNKMTKVLNDDDLELSSDLHPLGFSNELNADIFYAIGIDSPNEECPYKYVLYAKNDEELYEFQNVRFFIQDDTAYIGAIQGVKNQEITSFKKKIKRSLYKANENVGIENPIYNTNPGAVVAVTSFIAFMNSIGISNFCILPPSIQRWNDKQILSQTLEDKLLSNMPNDTTKLKIKGCITRNDEYFMRYETIRIQLTNALKRFSFHFPNVDEEYFEKSYLIKCGAIENGNNQLLNEIYGLSISTKKANHLD